VKLSGDGREVDAVIGEGSFESTSLLARVRKVHRPGVDAILRAEFN
jgi:hypothetical protein